MINFIYIYIINDVFSGFYIYRFLKNQKNKYTY